MLIADCRLPTATATATATAKATWTTTDTGMATEKETTTGSTDGDTWKDTRQESATSARELTGKTHRSQSYDRRVASPCCKLQFVQFAACNLLPVTGDSTTGIVDVEKQPLKWAKHAVVRPAAAALMYLQYT